MRFQAGRNVLACLVVAACISPLLASAQEPLEIENEGTSQTLGRLERRLDDLEAQNQSLLGENARLLDQLAAEQIDTSLSDISFVPSPSTLTQAPGEGVTISMLNDSSRLTIGATLSGLSTFSTKRQFSPSLPLLLFPGSPTNQDTNTFGLHARQSSINARFSGPEVCGLTPGGEMYTLFFNDNITDDNYGMLVYFAYGELKNEEMRFAAGIQKDVFNPIGPAVLPISVLYASGNAGSYRGQIRGERYVPFGNDSQLTCQLGLSEPIATLVRDRLVDPLIEDNGWPNVEGRLLVGLGEAVDLMGGRKQRLVELSLSGVVGQIRISKPIPGPGTPGPDRIVNDVWAVGGDFQIALTDRFGIKGESFVGQSLAEYNAGALQNFNSDTFLPIQTIGGFGEIYYYVNPQFHLHGGYGIDDPINADLAAGQISSNETFFLTAFWDISKNVQFGMEVDWRKTKYISPLLDAEGLLVMNQFLWRF